MVSAVEPRLPREPQYLGLRLSADEYFNLADDGFRYELIHGVMVMSPSPMFLHAEVLGHFEFRLRLFLETHPLGRVAQEIDWRAGPDLVYRPDLMFFAAGRVPPARKRITTRPDFILEVISPGSAALDHRTKKQDYERLGVPEYWIIDPQKRTVEASRLVDGKYRTSTHSTGRVESSAIPGFELDAAALWAAALGE